MVASVAATATDPGPLSHRTRGASAVVDRDTLDLVAQVAVQVADESVQHLPLVVFHLGVDLGDEQVAGGLVPLDPAGVLDVLPAPLARAAERGVRPAQVPLRALQHGLQAPIAARFRDDLYDLHGGHAFWYVPEITWPFPPRCLRHTAETRYLTEAPVTTLGR